MRFMLKATPENVLEVKIADQRSASRREGDEKAEDIVALVVSRIHKK